MSSIRSQMHFAIATATNYELLGRIASDPARRANCEVLAAFHEGLASEFRQELEKHIQATPKGSAQPDAFPQHRPIRQTRWHYAAMVLGYATLTVLFLWFILDRGSKLI
jgi:hypothetical protein